jgi:rhodanese-related sulfurtransferase
VKTIGREELKEKIERDDDFLLLEVLSEQSYARGHLPGAIRFPGSAAIPDLLPDKTAQVVAYCSSFT